MNVARVGIGSSDRINVTAKEDQSQSGACSTARPIRIDAIHQHAEGRRELVHLRRYSRVSACDMWGTSVKDLEGGKGRVVKRVTSK